MLLGQKNIKKETKKKTPEKFKYSDDEWRYNICPMWPVVFCSLFGPALLLSAGEISSRAEQVHFIALR